MHNPFQYGAPVSGEYYLPRPELTKSVAHYLENRISVVLIGPRRIGKSSFVAEMLRYLEQESFTCLSVDIFSITSHEDFLKEMLKAIKAKKRLLKAIQTWFASLSGLSPRISAELDPHTGQSGFGLTFGRSPEWDVKEAIDDTLLGLGKLGHRVVVAIDEFHKIAELNDRGWLEATLRTCMQQLKNTTFLFTGSRRSIVYDMLNNRSRPFYRFCQPIEFPPFHEEFTDWIIQRFDELGVTCSADIVHYIRKVVLDIPSYVQMMCFNLAAQRLKHITIEDVDRTFETILQQNTYPHQTTWKSLETNQQRTLRLIAYEGGKTFPEELLAKYEIPDRQALASAIESLKVKELLDIDISARDAVMFEDPFFATWINPEFCRQQS